MASLTGDYFDALYARKPDPWDFESSNAEYERGKYADTIASLPRDHYAAGVEIGCSIGILSRMLAAHCDSFLATDVSEAPLVQARQRNADLKNIVFRRMRFPDEPLPGRYDLVVLSEVLYYFDEDELHRLAAAAMDVAQPGGDVMLVHWILDNDCPLPGDVAVEAFLHDVAPRVDVLEQKRRERYRIDILRRRP